MLFQANQFLSIQLLPVAIEIISATIKTLRWTCGYCDSISTSTNRWKMKSIVLSLFALFPFDRQPSDNFHCRFKFGLILSNRPASLTSLGENKTTIELWVSIKLVSSHLTDDTICAGNAAMAAELLVQAIVVGHKWIFDQIYIFVQLGAVSWIVSWWALNCARPNYPIFNSRVSHFVRLTIPIHLICRNRISDCSYAADGDQRNKMWLLSCLDFVTWTQEIS